MNTPTHHAAHIAAAVAVTLDTDASPTRRLLAWCCLKTARGQTVRQDVLRRMPVQVGRAV